MALILFAVRSPYRSIMRLIMLSSASLESVSAISVSGMNSGTIIHPWAYLLS